MLRIFVIFKCFRNPFFSTKAKSNFLKVFNLPFTCTFAKVDLASVRLVAVVTFLGGGDPFMFDGAFKDVVEVGFCCVAWLWTFGDSRFSVKN